MRDSFSSGFRCAAVLCGLFTAAQALAEKRIALTYDDAPRSDSGVFTGEARATALMEALKSVDAPPVVFFVTTRGLTTQKDGVQRIERYAQAGHLIANHSHTHTWAHKQPVEAYLSDIDVAEQHLQDFDNRRAWYRFPYLDEGRSDEKVASIQKGLRKRGLQNGYVTVDNYDWYVDAQLQKALREARAINYEALGRFYVRMLLYAAEYYDSIAVQTLGESPVHVLLLHENDIAAMYADDLVTALRDTGWTIVSPDVAYDAPLPAPESVHTGQGRVVALAADAGRARHTMWTWAIDEQMIDLQLARSGAFAAPEN